MTDSPKPGFAHWLQFLQKRWWLVAALFLAVVAAGYFGLQHRPSMPDRDLAQHSQLELNLAKPDALIESYSLAKLPRDLLEIPLLKDTLTEDFVFYYESNPDRLGLAGSLRRIAYEHELQLHDQLINELLDEPATVALWRGGTGKLAYALILIERNGLSNLLTTLAKAALDDKRFKAVAKILVNGDETPIYRLAYGSKRAVLFAVFGDRIAILNDSGMLFDDAFDDRVEEESEDNSEEESGADSNEASDQSAEAQRTAKKTKKLPKLAKDQTLALESVLAAESSFFEHFGLETSTAQHRITVSADYLAMGYRAFFPALAGFSIEKDQSGWRSRIAFDPVDNPETLDFQTIWRAMPMGASACIAAPISTELPKRLLARLAATAEQQKVFVEHLRGPVGICWYGSSHLYTPLLVTRDSGTSPEQLDQVAGSLFEQVIGGIERSYPGKRFPVQTTSQANGKRWQRMVGSNFGQYAADQAIDPSVLKSTGFFNVSLARQDDMLIFSLDDSLVDEALATLAKNYPPLFDQLPKDRMVPFYVAPERLAPLLELEALQSLPADLEPVFHNAAQQHLLPKLKKFAAFGKVALTLPKDSEPDEDWHWLPVTWQML